MRVSVSSYLALLSLRKNPAEMRSLRMTYSINVCTLFRFRFFFALNGDGNMVTGEESRTGILLDDGKNPSFDRRDRI